MKFQKPCLICGELSPNNRCPRHLAEQKMRKKILHNNPTYKAQAKRVRDEALVCHICGQGKKDNDPFTADHLYPGDPLSPLLPAHRSCNSRRGNDSGT